MPRHLFSLEDISAILAAVDVDAATQQRFQDQADRAAAARRPLGDSRCEVASGFGASTKRGFVTLQLGNVAEQMTPAKAIEIAGMLHSAAEAAISDELIMRLLDKIGVGDDPNMRAAILLELRELRQGSRGTVYPQ